MAHLLVADVGTDGLEERADQGRALVGRVGPAHLQRERRILGPVGPLGPAGPAEPEALGRLGKNLRLSFEEQGERA